MESPPRSVSSPPLRLGLVGCGLWGANLFREFDALSSVEVVALCDADPSRLQAIRSLKPDARAHSQVDSLLADDVDAVLVATPNESHHAIARSALLADKHVYVEKLLGTTAAHATELDDLAARRDLVLMVGHVCLHDHVVEKMMGEVSRGVTGTPRHIRAARAALGRIQPDVNVLWDLAPHDLSILLRLMDRAPDRVAACGHRFVGPHEEIATLRAEYVDGPVFDLFVSWLDPVKERRWIVTGDEGALVYDALEPEPLAVQRASVRLAGEASSGAYEYISADERGVVPLDFIGESPLRRLGRHFIDCVSTGASPITGGAHGASILAILEACDSSIRAGGAFVELIGGSPAGVVHGS